MPFVTTSVGSFSAAGFVCFSFIVVCLERTQTEWRLCDVYRKKFDNSRHPLERIVSELGPGAKPCIFSRESSSLMPRWNAMVKNCIVFHFINYHLHTIYQIFKVRYLRKKPFTTAKKAGLISIQGRYRKMRKSVVRLHLLNNDINILSKFDWED